MVTDKFLIREQNVSLVLNTIIRESEISRAKISQISGLNKASVSTITKDLIDNDLVFEIGEGEANKVGGRKPIILTFNHKAGLVLSMDLGPDYISGMLTYLNGEIINYENFEDIHLTSNNVFTYIVALYTQLTSQEYPDTPYGIVGLSLAIHGTVKDNQIMLTPNYTIGNEFIEQLAQYLSMPIYLENEANLAALGEYCFAGEYNHLVSLNIHTGIGAGFVQNGIIYQGFRGNSGEIGHSIIVPNGKACPCGNHGCLEQYASLASLTGAIKKELKLDHVSTQDIAQLYNKNEPVTQLVNENATYLSIAINNLGVLFDPEVIIINHPLYQALPHLIDEVRANLNSSLTTELIVHTSTLYNLATLYGGVANVVKQYLNIEDLKFLKTK
ncbi:ROK family protein [Fundicoccus culcitae]|uniref:ROK family protein n=1 Tax=Fundicoccus culcitae TaxID=2969821 RepID=A0ABY5PAD5_9LACT|nr:ROK family protein [Fundicoccus culcitae]UUX35368.1 ROK family protein [Fundicoccus culcitae]